MVWTGGENLAHTDYIILAHCGCVFVALVIQRAKGMLRFILSSLATFSTLSHQRHGFPKRKAEHKIYILIFSTTFVQNISHAKKYINVHRSSGKVSVILVRV